MNAAGVANPRGIFDRGAKGATLPPLPVFVERGRIRFFAEVLGETGAVHIDVDAARAAGHPDLVAPASFFMVIEADANRERDRRGQRALLDMVGCDFRYLLHGEERYFYGGPIYAGEEVLVNSRVVDFYDKKGGAMEFVTIESTVTSPKRGTLVRAERSLLHRLPEGKR